MGCGGSKQTDVVQQPSPKHNGTSQSPTKSVGKGGKHDTSQSPTKSVGKGGKHDTSQSPTKSVGKGGKHDTSQSPTKSVGKGDKQQNSPQGKYIVNGSTNGVIKSESEGSEITDKGFKRKIREKLRFATENDSIEDLEIAMDRFQRHHLEDKGDYTRAKERLHFLTLRRDLRDAIRRSHVGVLEKTIADARDSQFAGKLQKQIDAAERKLAHLKELDKYKHDILHLEQTTISEIHSYQRPPSCVHDVMAATYMLLGHPEPKLTDWSDIQSLTCRVGRDSLIHQVHDFDSNNVDDQTARRVRDILQPHHIDTVRQASNGAATFYVWTKQICDKIDRDKQQEEDRLRQEELERQKREENDKKSPKKKG